MIYQRFGLCLTIVGYCGFHQPTGFAAPIMLVKVRYEDDGLEGFQFPIFLKADGGTKEIEAAIDAAPEIELGPKALKAAIHNAL